MHDGRFDLREVLRQYTAAHLEADTETFAASKKLHYAFYLALAETADSQLRGPGQLEWLHRLEQEHDNLRAAPEWSFVDCGKLPHERDNFALKLAGALRWFQQIRGFSHEGCHCLAKALDLGSLEDANQRESSGTRPRARGAIPADQFPGES